MGLREDLFRDSGHHRKPLSSSGRRFGFRAALWRAVKILRDQDSWARNSGEVGHLRRVVEAHRKNMVQTLEERGKEELNRCVAFMGIAIAECDELLEACERLDLIQTVRNQNRAQLARDRGIDIQDARRNADAAQLRKTKWLRLTKSGPSRISGTVK